MSFPSLENVADVQLDSIDIERPPLKYSNAYPQLPSTRPVDFPHIIDTQPVFDELTDPVKLRLCDGVATVLFHYDPAFLSQFLDLSIPEVFFLREENSTSKDDCVIYRNHRTVTCAFYHRVDNNILDYGARITSNIHADGRWETTSADAASLALLPRPISPVELTKFGMRYAQALFECEDRSIEEPVKIHTTKPEWWDTVNHYVSYGYQPWACLPSETIESS